MTYDSVLIDGARFPGVLVPHEGGDLSMSDDAYRAACKTAVVARAVLTGPEFVQVEDSRHCSSAWDENCCDLPSWHDGLHRDDTNGNRWAAPRVNVVGEGCLVLLLSLHET